MGDVSLLIVGTIGALLRRTLSKSEPLSRINNPMLFAAPSQWKENQQPFDMVLSARETGMIVSRSIV